MNERSAILLAGAAHLALLAALSLSWAMAAKTLPSFEEMTPVEVVQIDDVPKVTEIPKPSMEAVPQETQEAAAPVPAPEPKPAPPPPAPAPPKRDPPKAVSDVPSPDAKPTPTPVAKTQEKPAPDAKASAKTTEKPAPDAKPEAKKVAAKPLDTQTLANLLDKKLPNATAKPLDTSKFADTIEKSLPKGAKIDARAAATLQQAIQAQVAPCWNPPIGGEDVRHMTVVLRIQLSKDGRLTDTPVVIAQTGKTSGNDAYSRAFAESAKRAVARCAPLKLPAELYDAWRLFELNFDPSQMT